MTETFHIFDEFPPTADQMTDELRHQKRVKLEPLIFDIVKKKYSAKLDAFWKETGPTIQQDRCILLVERRIHENLEFCLKSAAYFGRDWSIGIVCSDVNLEYCKQVVAPHADKVYLLPFFRGSPGRDQARDEYTHMLKDASFYQALPWKHICIMQTDSYFRKPIPKGVLQYDLVAAPATWDLSSLVGGLSFRNRDAMIRICREFQENIPSEDLFLDRGSIKLEMKRPDCYTAMEYVCESFLFDDPVALHQWWTFFTPDLEDAEEFFHNYLRLEIV